MALMRTQPSDGANCENNAIAPRIVSSTDGRTESR